MLDPVIKWKWHALIVSCDHAHRAYCKVKFGFKVRPMQREISNRR